MTMNRDSGINQRLNRVADFYAAFQFQSVYTRFLHHAAALRSASSLLI